MTYPPVPSKENIIRLRKRIDTSNIAQLSTKSSLENKILTKKQLLLKKAAQNGITFDKKPKISNLILKYKESNKSIKSLPKKDTSSTKLITAFFPKKNKTLIKSNTSIKTISPITSPFTNAYKSYISTRNNINFKRNNTPTKKDGTPVFRSTMTPAVEAKTKKWEIEFVDKFNAHFVTPKNVILADKFNNFSKIIPNVYGARVLFDSRARSPHITKSHELGRIVTSKADIALFTKIDNRKVDIAWLSHKQPLHMQYLDVSADVNFLTQKNAEKEIKSFKHKMLQIAKMSESQLCWPRYKNGKSIRVWQEIRSDTLKSMAMFGVEYGKEFGRNNVNAIFAGKPKIIEQNDTAIVMSSTDMSLLNGHIDKLPEQYQPIFFVKPTKTAKSKIDNKTIKGVSVWIIYKSYVSKGNKEIDAVVQHRDSIVGAC